jgi:hypothetical protein
MDNISSKVTVIGLPFLSTGGGSAMQVEGTKVSWLILLPTVAD